MTYLLDANVFISAIARPIKSPHFPIIHQIPPLRILDPTPL